ncbi:cystathionine gamma-synthase family protein [Psychromonas antarctica]|jgi:O-acetylhomoserine (thiol)-lyase|uniref:cystathionine gamma-synthase family protein n=1 Tax=Psychromonas antarctica TaxID=67573 RepID=UPI001EE78710|nr:cystathionine gamma-synthase family protein [Psychromonas antarctica]MCG6199874.1 cystathionine gamma-synthase family protein [Psychromonas antarctica]
MSEQGFTTKIVHSDRLLNLEYGAVHAPIHNSVPYGFDDVQDLINIFQGQPGHAYARQSTPTIDALQHKLCQMDNGYATLAFASGMAAIVTTFLSLLKSGDHLICSRFLFGNTNSVMGTLQSYGIEVTLVDTTNIEEVKAAQKDNTRMVFAESIANPVTQISALDAIGDFCEKEKLVYVIDNTMASCYLFDATTVKASLIITSLSKYVAGHGNALGGAVTDSGLFDWQAYPNIFEGYRKGDSKMWGISQIKKKGLRDMGGCMSSQIAHLISVGSETMELRMDRQCDNALLLAEFLEQHPKVAKVYYPGLNSHPQHDLAKRLFKKFGAILSFDLIKDEDCCKVLNKLDIVINATHLGDNRTLALPVAPTIYGEMGLAVRKQMGISETMVRCSIGIENSADLLADFKQALA